MLLAPTNIDFGPHLILPEVLTLALILAMLVGVSGLDPVGSWNCPLVRNALRAELGTLGFVFLALGQRRLRGWNGPRLGGDELPKSTICICVEGIDFPATNLAH